MSQVKRLKKALKQGKDLDVVAALRRSLALKGTADQEQLYEASEAPPCERSFSPLRSIRP